jgi:hypothetical protein
MAPQRRASRLGEEFIESYPDTLPLRLEWLADHLRIDRARFLRLMGLAAEGVEENFDTSWEKIAAKWKDQAWWVEELLCQLIAFFGYDWRALADRLHQPTEADAPPRPERVSSLNGHSGRLWTVPPDRREETLLTLISQGGPDALLWLVEYLTQSAADGTVPRNQG